METEPKFDVERLVDAALVLDRTFIRRTDLHARQLDNGSYICNRRPLTFDHLVEHLTGATTLGAYVLDRESRASYIVLDADTNDELAACIGMAGRLWVEGVPSYLEQSRRGGHLWLFFETPIPGERARLFGKGLIEAYELGGIELYPKQDRLDGGPGSLVRLPFGVHRKVGERYGFISPDGWPLSGSWPAQIEKLADPLRVPRAAAGHFVALGSTVEEAPPQPVAEPATGTLSDRIKASVSVYDFVGRYVDLSPVGRGLCPFHDDEHASFSVNIDENYWNCFAGCGGGSVIDFWMKYRRVDFSLAIKELAGLLL